MEFNPDWFTDRIRQFQGFREMLQREQPQTLMLIEAPDKRGKTWLLLQMAHHCRELDPTIPVVYLDFRDPLINKVDDFQVVQLLGESFEAPQFFQPLLSEIGRVSGDTVWLPAEPIQRLADEILLAFNSLAQIKPLFRYVDANYDFLPGDDAREKTFQFVTFCLEQNRLDRLLETLIDLREERTGSWRRLIEELQQAAENAASSLSAGQRATLQATGQERDHIMLAITAVFVDCLTNYLGQLDRLVLLIDSYEDCSYEAQRWLENSLLPYLPQDEVKTGLVLVVAGQRTLYVRDSNVKSLILRDREHEENPEKHGLALFNPEHIAEYIEKRNIVADWATPDSLMVTNGNPNLLAMIYEAQLNS